MKTLYLVGGTMGVGKTTACQALKRMLPDCAFLDGDWCWDMHPFKVTDETKMLVMENIRHHLNGFLRCSAFENVVFCWVMHEQEIIDDILARLDTDGWTVKVISLVCEAQELTRRLQRDVDAGIRTSDVIDRSASRLPMYEKLNSIKVDVTNLTPEETAESMKRL